MDVKVESKLIKLVNEFTGQTLKSATLKDDFIIKKKVLILELVFSKQTMVLALDKDVTKNDYKELAERLIK